MFNVGDVVRVDRMGMPNTFQGATHTVSEVRKFGRGKATEMRYKLDCGIWVYSEDISAVKMDYSDARYELLNMTVGFTKVVNGQSVTRWSAERWEIGTLGKGMQVLERTLDAMGFFPPRPG